MDTIEKFCGKQIEDQEHYYGYCSMLFGRPPEKLDVLAAENATDFVIFDGECWREFHKNGVKKAG